MKTRLYGCYGSNLNKNQMAYRCPDAKPLGVVYLKDYVLVYDRVASIEFKKGACVPIGLWSISENDEISLDSYEGYPHLYTKKDFIIDINGKKETVMIYIKNNMNNYSMPNIGYFHTIMEGYNDFNIDLKYLTDSLDYSYKMEVTHWDWKKSYLNHKKIR